MPVSNLLRLRCWPKAAMAALESDPLLLPLPLKPLTLLLKLQFWNGLRDSPVNQVFALWWRLIGLVVFCSNWCAIRPGVMWAVEADGGNFSWGKLNTNAAQITLFCLKPTVTIQLNEYSLNLARRLNLTMEVVTERQWNDLCGWFAFEPFIYSSGCQTEVGLL